MSIEELRKRIDEIDDKISSLYVERLTLTDEIGEIKRRNGQTVTDISREREIRARITEKAGDNAESVNILYDTIFTESKERQRKNDSQK